MKKKIINGILLAAMLFAGTTSFVSCKDNVDDELIPVYTDLSGLKTRVGNLETTVAGHTTDIQNLRTDLTTLENQVKANTESIDTLNARYDRLVKRIEKCEEYVANLTVGIEIQGTVDPVLGEVRGLLLDKNTLLGFVGLNDSKIEEFPVAGDDYNVKGFTEKLKASEIDEDDVITFKGAKKEWLMEQSTFGRVYASLNPLGADATKCTFTLVPTGAFFKDGQFSKKAPITFSQAYPATKDITLALGKKAGMDWNEFMAATAWDPETDGFPVTWAFDAVVDSTDFSGFKFDWTTFNSDYAQGWKMDNLKGTIKEIWDGLKDSSKPKTERVAVALQQAQGVFKLIADAINDKYTSLPKYAVGAVVNETGRGIVSQATITSAAIEPIGYSLAVNFDAVSGTYKWNLANVKYIASKILKKIQPELPELASEIKITGAAGSTIKVYDAGTATTYEIDVEDVVDELNLDELETMVNDALKFYTRVKSGTGATLLTKVEKYLNRVTGNLLDYYGDIATISVQPLMLFDSPKGLVKMVDGLPTNLSIKDGADYDFVLTSLTGEYIIPVFMKYVALIADGEIQESYVVPGSQKVFPLTIPEGTSEIVVQTMDYSGYTITQRYPINGVNK